MFAADEPEKWHHDDAIKTLNRSRPRRRSQIGSGDVNRSRSASEDGAEFCPEANPAIGMGEDLPFSEAGD